MTRRIRYYLDENVNLSVAAGLRRAGIDVKTTQESGLLGANDHTQLALAIQENRVIVTHDDDFLVFANQGVEHPGIAYCQKDIRSIGEIIRSLVLLHEVGTVEEMRDRIEFL